FGVRGALTDLVLGVRNEPDLILQLGGTPTSSVVERLRAPRIVIAPHGWSDATATATDFVVAGVAEAADALAAALGRPAEPSAWAAELARADALAWRIVEDLCRGEALGEAQVARAVVRSVPANGLFAVGNSLPIRMVDLSCPADWTAVPVLSQR